MRFLFPFYFYSWFSFTETFLLFNLHSRTHIHGAHMYENHVLNWIQLQFIKRNSNKQNNGNGRSSSVILFTNYVRICVHVPVLFAIHFSRLHTFPLNNSRGEIVCASFFGDVEVPHMYHVEEAYRMGFIEMARLMYKVSM